MLIFWGIIAGLVVWGVVRLLLTGIYTVDQNERAVVTTLGRAERIGERTTIEDPIATTASVSELSPSEAAAAYGVSINDLRKNLGDLNEHMDQECKSSAARYGMVLDASLITGIDPPKEVESALAAINTAHNQVSSDISLAQAAADQKIVQSRRAVEIETLNAQAEIEPLERMAAQLGELKRSGPGVLQSYLRNVRMSLFSQAEKAFVELKS